LEYIVASRDPFSSFGFLFPRLPFAPFLMDPMNVALPFVIDRSIIVISVRKGTVSDGIAGKLEIFYLYVLRIAIS